MNESMKIVIALGGNAISDPAAQGTIAEQFARTRETATILADLIEDGHKPIVTHGNGPQVGSILRRVELASREVYPVDLGLCVADSQASMGYMIAQCVTNELAGRHIDRIASALVTTVRVDQQDPAFKNPTKPIGNYYTEEEARHHQEQDNWKLVEVAGKGFRRVVPSPKPQEIIELPLVRRLFDAGELLVVCGGGGIPVIWTEGWGYEGLEAVIDKDLTAALLARGLNADVLAILTEPDCVYDNWGTPDEQPLPELTLTEARRRLAAGEFPAGSMAPKIQAAVNFVENNPNPDARAVITSHQRLVDAMHGLTGTWFRKAKVLA